MTYCKNMFCNVCKHHAADHILSNPPNLYSFMTFFDWLINFHNNASIHSGKKMESHELIKDIYFYKKFSKDLTFNKCSNGVFHFLFLVCTKIENKEEIFYLYILTHIFFENFIYDDKGHDKDSFNKFITTYNFEEFLKTENLDFIYMRTSFFCWLYMLYKTINESKGIEVYDFDTVSKSYFEMKTCDLNCDK